MTVTVSGRVALSVATYLGLRVSKYADPTEEALENLDVVHAETIVRSDPDLIYFHVNVNQGDLKARIRLLAEEAAQASDFEQVALCQAALEGQGGALAECLSVLTEWGALS